MCRTSPRSNKKRLKGVAMIEKNGTAFRRVQMEVRGSRLEWKIRFVDVFVTAINLNKFTVGI